MTGGVSSFRVWRSTDFAAVRRGAQGLFLEFRLLHQPMRETAQQIEMRAAAVDSRAPTATSGRQQQRDAALALAREHEQRLVLALQHAGAALALRR